MPSLLGYAFGSKPPLDRDLNISSLAHIFNELMYLLGFADGYTIQDSDFGSEIFRTMGFGTSIALVRLLCLLIAREHLADLLLQLFIVCGARFLSSIVSGHHTTITYSQYMYDG